LGGSALDRPVLTNSLQSASYAGVVLVSAPAGSARPLLVAGLLAALDPILHLDPDTRDGLEGPESPLEEFVLRALVEACIARGQPLVLVLDDVHLVTDRRSHAAIAYLGDQVATCTA
jgi:ATP/maltotriose-dependent transcriptional regulator MalT